MIFIGKATDIKGLSKKIVDQLQNASLRGIMQIGGATP